MTDKNGNKIEDLYYYPYGKVYTDTGSIKVKHKFTGQEFDTESGLYYYGVRYYEPEIGRFISADSIVQDYTDPQTLNRYSYCRNNLVTLTDPNGNIFGIEDLLTAVIVGSLIGGVTSGVTGGDIGMGMLTGGISGGMSKYFGGFLPRDFGAQFAGRSLIGSVTGGITAELYGGDFVQGFAIGAATSAIGFIANEVFH